MGGFEALQINDFGRTLQIHAFMEATTKLQVIP